MGDNLVRIICGPRGCGKTTRARAAVREDLDDGCWVFAHDPLHQYRGLLAPYKSVNEWVAAVREAVDKKAPMPRGAAFQTKTPLDLVELVERLGERWNTADTARFPMSLWFDEGALLAQGTWIDQRLNSLLAVARHRRVRLGFLIQRRAHLSVQFWDMVNHAYLFRQPTGSAKDLEAPLSLGVGTLRGLEKLQNYQYVHVVAGDGPSREP